MATSKSKPSAIAVPAKKTAKTAVKTPIKPVVKSTAKPAPAIIGKAKPVKPKKAMATTSQILSVGADLLG